MAFPHRAPSRGSGQSTEVTACRCHRKLAMGPRRLHVVYGKNIALDPKNRYFYTIE